MDAVMLQAYPSISRYHFGRESGSWDFYRCAVCRSLITFDQERTALTLASTGGPLSVCKCGALRYSPGQPGGLMDWVSLPVLSYTWHLYLARAVAPWAAKHAKSLLPVIERLLRS